MPYSLSVSFSVLGKGQNNHRLTETWHTLSIFFFLSQECIYTKSRKGKKKELGKMVPFHSSTAVCQVDQAEPS